MCNKNNILYKKFTNKKEMYKFKSKRNNNVYGTNLYRTDNKRRKMN